MELSDQHEIRCRNCGGAAFRPSPDGPDARCEHCGATRRDVQIGMATAPDVQDGPGMCIGFGDLQLQASAWPEDWIAGVPVDPATVPGVPLNLLK